MARPARLTLPGYPHHVVQRGHNRAPVFEDDEDRRHYLAVLRDVARDARVPVHAYVLMPNHVHLLLTPPDETALSRMMQNLGRRHVVWFNQRHGRSGTLWEGRFRAHVLDPDHYLLSCMRFIELNPQRQALASSLLEYPWSSAAHHLGQLQDPLVSDPPQFWQLGNTPFEREAAWRQWLEQGVSPVEAAQFTTMVQRGGVLGDAAFVARLQSRSASRLTPRPRGRPRTSA